MNPVTINVIVLSAHCVCAWPYLPDGYCETIIHLSFTLYRTQSERGPHALCCWLYHTHTQFSYRQVCVQFSEPFLRELFICKTKKVTSYILQHLQVFIVHWQKFKTTQYYKLGLCSSAMSCDCCSLLTLQLRLTATSAIQWLCIDNKPRYLLSRLMRNASALVDLSAAQYVRR